jgi:hypothetical protein
MTYAGVLFDIDARWRFRVFYRYAGSGRANVYVHDGFHDVMLPGSALAMFNHARKLRDGGDVYLIDCDDERCIAHARRGRVLFNELAPTTKGDQR